MEINNDSLEEKERGAASDTGADPAEAPSSEETEETEEKNEEKSKENGAENKPDTAKEETKPDSEAAEDKKERLINGKIIVIALCLAAAAAITVFAFKFLPSLVNQSSNKYNRGYYDVTGRTVGDVAEREGLELDEFLETYDLPDDMPADTYEHAAYNIAPIGTVVMKIRDKSFDEYVKMLDLPETVTEKTPYGEAIGEAKLKNIVGEQNFSEFKERYGFGDEVTPDTLWKDVSDVVYKADMELRLKNESTQNEEPIEQTDDDDNAEDEQQSGEDNAEQNEAADGKEENNQNG